MSLYLLQRNGSIPLASTLRLISHGGRRHMVDRRKVHPVPILIKKQIAVIVPSDNSSALDSMQVWKVLQPVLSVPSPSFQTPPTTQSSVRIRILTHNIRYAASDLFRNEKPWPERYPLILSQLKHETRFLDGSLHPRGTNAASAFICLQEVLHVQLVNILDGLNNLEVSRDPASSDPVDGPLWAHVGVGRDDGKRRGEYSPIIYPIKLYELLHSETVWLIPTPDTPSRGWDAGSIRILTAAVFEHKATGRRLMACNTHLDNAGTISREKSVEIILDTIKRVRKEWSSRSKTHADEEGLPVFLASDFNSFPTQEAYLAMKSSRLMREIRELVNPESRYGNEITFTAFRPDQDNDEHERIDFVWVGPGHAICGVQNDESNEEVRKETGKCIWSVDGYAVLSNLFEQGIYSSDHRCVVGDVLLL